jgi:hypothetical protein
MGKLLKKTEEKLKKAGHKVEDGAKSAGHSVAEGSKSAGHKIEDGAKSAGHTVAEGAKSAGHKTKVAAGHAVGAVDVTCDKCGKLMKPGGAYTRTIQGKEYQFCSVLCADHFHPPMKEP